MPKKQTSIKTQSNSSLDEVIMNQIQSGSIQMKPRWYFVIGSLLSLIGLTGFTMLAIFLFNISFFCFRNNNPMGQWRLELMLSSFPWWIIIVALLSVVAGLLLLKRYDFTYRHNQLWIMVIFVGSILFASWLIDTTGLNEQWSQKGPMRGIYRHLEGFKPRQSQPRRYIHR